MATSKKRPPVNKKSMPDLKSDSPPTKESEQVDYWLKELRRADRHEEDWRKLASELYGKYRNDDRKDSANAYNVFYSSVEVLRGALYQRPPIPEVKRRFKDKDPVGRAVSEVLDRALTFSIDDGSFDTCMRQSLLDRLVVGRGIDYQDYKPELVGKGDDEEVAFERATDNHVDWDLFRYQPNRKWVDVDWVAFGRPMTRRQLKAKYKDKGALVELDYKPNLQLKSQSDDQPFPDDSTTKTNQALVWTIWDKTTKKVWHVTSGYKTEPLAVFEDPLRISGFFPCPQPLYGQMSTTSLIPVPDYIQYQDQHLELNTITERITNLIDQCRRNGVYDASIPELAEVCTQDDGVFVAVENYSAIVDKGGVQNAIFEMPIEGISKVVQNLYAQREQCKQAIYEITGIGDIVRGASDPNETATAQTIKDNYANNRVGPAQREIQRYARDLLRIKAEIIAEHFSEDTLKKMTGIELPATKEEAMMMAQQQAQGQAPMAPKPSWEEVMDLLRNDKLRSFRIDIETDSTLVIDDASDRKALSDTVQSMGFTLQSLSSAVEGGAISKQAAQEIFMGVIRQTGFGNRVEEAIEANPAPDEPKEDPMEQMKVEAQRDVEMEKYKLLGQKEIEDVRAKKELKLREMDHKAKIEQELLKTGGIAQMPNGQAFSFVEAFMGLTQAIAGINDNLNQIAARMSAPKRLIYDDAGNLIGREIAGFGIEPIQRDVAGRIIAVGQTQ